MKTKKRECNMCGKNIPPCDSYPTEWCWMCLRSTVEKEYSRYYYRGKEGHYEEVIELAGVCPFSEENKELIKKIRREKYRAERRAGWKK